MLTLDETPHLAEWYLGNRQVSEQVRLVAIKENIELRGAQDIRTKVMITMFSLFAEIERDLIAERTNGAAQRGLRDLEADGVGS